MRGKTLDIINLSEFVLAYSFKNEIVINPLKLQKLLYYIQAWHLVFFDNNPLFNEVPEAWVNGPVYRNVFNRFKSFQIYNPLKLKDVSKIDKTFEDSKLKLDLDSEQWDFLNAILRHYGLMSHEKLVYLTHSENPWNEARGGLNAFDYSDNKISHESMYQYYKMRHDSDNAKS
jgi:uncharacterized phage-associated protein